MSDIPIVSDVQELAYLLMNTQTEYEKETLRLMVLCGDIKETKIQFFTAKRVCEIQAELPSYDLAAYRANLPN